MSEQLWHRVAERLNEHSYMAGVERTVERVRATGEIFTPTELVIEMLRYCNLDLFVAGKTVLDPACGDGQFLVAVKWIKILHHGMLERDALADLYGVDIMRDNVDLCRRRLGGGTIVMGDALKPANALVDQTDEERKIMISLFDEAPSVTRKKPRVAGRKPNARTPRATPPAEVVAAVGDPFANFPPDAPVVAALEGHQDGDPCPCLEDDLCGRACPCRRAGQGLPTYGRASRNPDGLALKRDVLTGRLLLGACSTSRRSVSSREGVRALTGD
jgi:hypothetical protein